MLAQVSQADALRQLALDQVDRCLGEQHLPAVPRSRYACRAVYVQAHVTGGANLWLARVQPHAHAYADAVPPRVSSQRALRLYDGVQGIRCAGECNEEPVASVVYDSAAVALTRVADD